MHRQQLLQQVPLSPLQTTAEVHKLQLKQVPLPPLETAAEVQKQQLLKVPLLGTAAEVQQ